jgi:hypothetical protein
LTAVPVILERASLPPAIARTPALPRRVRPSAAKLFPFIEALRPSRKPLGPRGLRLIDDPGHVFDGSFPLAHIQAETSEGGKVLAGPDGAFTVPGKGREPVEITLRLRGRFARVKDAEGRDLVLKRSARPGDKLVAVFDPSDADENALAQASAYRHVNEAHDWIRAQGIGLKKLDRTVRVLVNRNEGESKYKPQYLGFWPFFGWTFPRLFFGKAGFSFSNAAKDDMIYHEFGHWVHDATGGWLGDFNAGLGEGWADIVSMFMTGQPLVGRDFKEKGSSLRTGENGYRFDKKDEEHVQGQAWMGFAWKLRKSLIASLGEAEGSALASSLVIPVFLEKPRSIAKAISRVLARDVGPDGIAPHFDAIAAAAQAHGFDLREPEKYGPWRQFFKGWKDHAKRWWWLLAGLAL